MNGNDYILAFADIHDDLIRAASDDAAVCRAFRQYRARRNKTIGALCCCAVIAMVAVGFGLKNRFGKQPSVVSNEPAATDRLPTEPDGTELPDQPGVIPQEQTSSTVETPSSDDTEPFVPETETPTQDTPVPQDDDSVIWGDTHGTLPSAYVLWNGKQIDYYLWTVLQSDTSGKVIAIVASPAIDYQFVYDGKTIARYEAEAYEERLLPEKLQRLLKEGETLKYGEDLYTIGTPDGEKWAKSLYEEKIAYYGEELLSRYIVNGDFLSDRVAADIPPAEADTSAKDAYDKAIGAFYAQTVSSAASAISAAGLSCSVTERGALLFFASAERFVSLTAPEDAEWYYSLAEKDADGTVPTRECSDMRVSG
ncbi:MAG: hypothetical protein IK104_07475 [Clostridia bacterium]|nr:hypothetical protein [Clostridia bacterium]